MMTSVGNASGRFHVGKLWVSPIPCSRGIFVNIIWNGVPVQRFAADAPCECNKKLASASTKVVLFAATRAPTGPAGEKPHSAGRSLVFVFAVPNVSIAPAGTPNFRSIPRLSSLCDGASYRLRHRALIRPVMMIVGLYSHLRQGCQAAGPMVARPPSRGPAHASRFSRTPKGNSSELSEPALDLIDP